MSIRHQLLFIIGILLVGINPLKLNAQGSGYHPPVYLGQTEMSSLVDIQYADISGNGYMDLIAISSFNIGWYENRGGGEFGRFRLIAESNGMISSAAVGDVTANGNADVVWINVYGQIILHNNNNGTFEEGVEILSNMRRGTIIISALEEGGHEYLFIHTLENRYDIIKVDATNPDEILVNEQFIESKFSNAFKTFQFKDYTGNGELDLLNVQDHWPSAEVFLFTSMNSGWAEKAIFSASSPISNTSSCDITQNGFLDFFIGTYHNRVHTSDEAGLYFLKNNGNRNFDQPLVIDNKIASRGFNKVVCYQSDQDNNYKLLATPSNELITDPSIYYYEYLENGEYSDRQLLFETDYLFDIILPLDVNNNGRMDLIAASTKASVLVWFERNAEGGFQPHKVIGETHTGIPRSIAVADFNGNGDLDLIVNSDALGKGLVFYENKGELIFEAHVIDPNLKSVIQAEAADLNANGLTDIVALSSRRVHFDYDHSRRDYLLSWYPNNGDGTFGAGDTIALFERFSYAQFSLADVNGNGHLDAIVNGVYYVENLGNAQFAEVHNIGIYPSIGIFLTEDIDGDGKEEIMIFREEMITEPIRRLVFNMFAIKHKSQNTFEVIDTLRATMPQDVVSYRYDDGSIVIVLLGQNEVLYQYKSAVTDSSLLKAQEPIPLGYYMNPQKVMVTASSVDGAIDIYTTSLLYRFELFGHISRHTVHADGAVTVHTSADTLRYYLQDMAIADLSNDGYQELIVAITGEDRVAIYQNSKVQDPFEGGVITDTTPLAFVLHQNYPNPFNPTTTIRYQIPTTSDVRLEVFDVLGRRVAILVNEQVSAGTHQVILDAGQLASGMYLYRLQAGDFVMTNKMLLIR